MCYALSVWYNHLHLCVLLLWHTVAFVPFAAEVFSPENALNAWKWLWCSDVSLGVEKCWLAYNVCSLWASLALNAAPQLKSVSQTFTGWCFSQWASLALNVAPLPKAECQSARLSLAVFLTVGVGVHLYLTCCTARRLVWQARWTEFLVPQTCQADERNVGLGVLGS